jgi:hypothetical protein
MVLFVYLLAWIVTLFAFDAIPFVTTTNVLGPVPIVDGTSNVVETT